MFARSVINMRLPGRPAWRPTGFVVLDQAGHQVLVLDRKLANLARIPAPIRDDRFAATVSADGSLVAFASLDRTVVTAANGDIRWQRECVLQRDGLPQRPAVHVDEAGRLWLYVPDGDHVAVFDARTGEEIDRTGLSSCIGAGEFVAHPDRVHLGLRVAQGQDGTNSYWLHLDGGRIVVRDLPGEILADVTRSGEQYLDLPHVDGGLAIRRFVDDEIAASCAAEGIPGFHDWSGSENDGPGYALNDGAAAFLDDDHVLVGVFTGGHDERQTESHLVLSARSLRWISTVDYGQSESTAANSIVPGHDRRWLTYDGRSGTATLWELDEAGPVPFDLP